MTGLALTRAPPAWRPLRFALAVPLWGMAAGALLLADGQALALGRWAPGAVALVHVYTLGVLGNAMLGSLYQFLPVAAATPLPGARAAPWVHAALNLGLLLFVAALYRDPRGLAAAAALLAAALLGVALPPLPALLRAGAQRLLRAGLATALLALAGTVALGVLAAGVLGGRLALPLDRLADAHAALGTGGWMLGLLAAVGAVTVPMFQGTAAVPARALRAWLATTAALLPAAVAARLAGAPPLSTAVALALPALALAAMVLWLQWHAPHARNPSLVRFWRAGGVAVAAAALAACTASLGASTAVLAGVLGIGIGVPLLVQGMLLEIVGFVSWIALRGRCPRGVRIPAVGRLLPEGDKRIALAVHLVAAAALLAASAWPPLSPAAGIALVAAHGWSLACMLRCLHRARQFTRDLAAAADRAASPAHPDADTGGRD